MSKFIKVKLKVCQLTMKWVLNGLENHDFGTKGRLLIILDVHIQTSSEKKEKSAVQKMFAGVWRDGSWRSECIEIYYWK
jgi:hypothetical protein